ncbi:uncharacterized protein TNCV_4894091 [Trichonephila clavipes]|nr:uncharacterized protein TNCV_4894091 [Trichonephila clavipes]
MEITRIEQHGYIKIAVFRGRKNAMKCHSELMEAFENNALPYRTVARWEPIRGRRFATRQDTANAVREQVTRFTHDAANAEADGIQCLSYHWQHVVTVAGEDRESVKDDKRCERPKTSRITENIEKVYVVVRKNMVQAIAESVGISSLTCQQIPTMDLNMHEVR